MRLPHVRTILTALALLSAQRLSARAQDHLEPEEAIRNAAGYDWNYAKKLRTVLLKNAPSYYLARMTCLPSFDPEWVVTVAMEEKEQRTAGAKVAYVVQYAGAEKSLWYQKKKWRDFAVKKAQVELDKETAEAIQEVWRRMLRTVRYPEKESGGLDGTTYHFARAVPQIVGGAVDPNYGFEEGQIHGPPESSAARELVTIGVVLRDYRLARNEDRGRLRLDLRVRAARLKAKLEGRRQPE